MARYYINSKNIQEINSQLKVMEKALDDEKYKLNLITKYFGHNEKAMLQIKSDINRSSRGILGCKKKLNTLNSILNIAVDEYKSVETKNYGEVNQVCINLFENFNPGSVIGKITVGKVGSENKNLIDWIKSEDGTTTILNTLSDVAEDDFPLASMILNLGSEFMFDDNRTEISLEEQITLGNFLTDFAGYLDKDNEIAGQLGFAGDVLGFTNNIEKYRDQVVSGGMGVEEALGLSALRVVAGKVPIANGIVEFSDTLEEYSEQVINGEMSIEEATITSGLKVVSDGAIGLGVAALIGVGVVASGVVVPGMAVGAAAIGITMAVNYASEQLFGKELSTFIAEGIVDLGQGAMELGGKAVNVINDTFTVASDLVNEASSAVGDFVGGAYDEVKNLFKGPSWLW